MLLKLGCVQQRFTVYFRLDGIAPKYNKGLHTGLSCCWWIGLICSSGEGVWSLPDSYPPSDTGEDILRCLGTLGSGTLTVRGSCLLVSMVFSLCPRCDISLDPMEMSTPVEARHLLTSVAQLV